MPDLNITGLTKKFGDNVVLRDLSLTVRDGEVLALLGPSGCGKSTTLWSVAGLHRPDGGRIAFGDRVVYEDDKIDVAPERRNCGVVFQSYAIWPHMSVFDNVAYPLKRRKVKGDRRRARVREVLDLVELGDHADRYPHQLSGGQQQRVALARALAHPPDMLLLDEPFSNLDAKLRERSREWLKALQQQVGITTVFVTHDQDEALSISDRVAVMDKGVIRQTGTPTEVYQNPADLFVADFVGTANVLPAEIVEVDGARAVVRLPGAPGVLSVPHDGSDVGKAFLSIRPEAIQIVRDVSKGTPESAIAAKVESVSYLGDHYRYVVLIGDERVVVTTTRPADDSELTIRLPSEDLRLFYPVSTIDRVL
ncbi:MULTISPECIES: ABC transporter ATP-binding protein [unclassified Spirillospora]|uniref:ABC transporter ATP-binding protein n=1 Tax=unclassified Spirillospora TaxID=2642701 RepID=UPI0037118C1F